MLDYNVPTADLVTKKLSNYWFKHYLNSDIRVNRHFYKFVLLNFCILISSQIKFRLS